MQTNTDSHDKHLPLTWMGFITVAQVQRIATTLCQSNMVSNSPYTGYNSLYSYVASSSCLDFKSCNNACTEGVFITQL